MQSVPITTDVVSSNLEQAIKRRGKIENDDSSLELKERSNLESDNPSREFGLYYSSEFLMSCFGMLVGFKTTYAISAYHH
jgi:hypothetical protein